MTAYKDSGTITTVVPWPQGFAGNIKSGGSPIWGAVHISADADAKQELTFGRDLYLFYDVVNNISQYNYLTVEPLVKNRDRSYEVGIPGQMIGLSSENSVELAARFGGVHTRWMVDFVTGTRDVDTDREAYTAEPESAGIADYIREVMEYMDAKE